MFFSFSDFSRIFIVFAIDFPVSFLYSLPILVRELIP